MDDFGWIIDLKIAEAKIKMQERATANMFGSNQPNLMDIAQQLHDADTSRSWSDVYEEASRIVANNMKQLTASY